MSLRRALAAAVSIAACALPAHLQAQSMDYDALESLFAEPVTSSATGAPQRSSEAPVDMEIITQDDIRRSGATDIPGALRFVTGVDERSYGVFQSEVGLRGYNQPLNPRLLVLVNGRQVYLDDYGEVIWANIPIRLEEIRQIELIKGPNSALYGFNAAYGVINIVTVDPLHDGLDVASLRGGSLDYAGGSLVGTAHVGGVAGVRLSIGGDRARAFDGTQAYLPGSPVSSAKAGTLNLDGKLQLSPSVLLTGEASTTDSRSVFNEGYSLSNVFVRTSAVRLGISADTGLGLLGLDGYRNEERYTDLPTYGDLRAPTWVLRASDVVRLGTGDTARLGAEYRNDWLYQPGAQVGYEIAAGSLMWRHRLAAGLSLTSSVRLDHVQLRYAGALLPVSGLTIADFQHRRINAISFNTALVWRVSERDTMRVIVARGVQIPSLWDLGVQQSYSGPPPYTLSGSPFLHPTTVLSLHLLYDRALPQIDSKLRLGLFAQRSDWIYTEPSSSAGVALSDGSTAYSAMNVGYSTAAGLELRLHGASPRGWRWSGSYAFATTADHTSVNVGATPTSYEDFGLSTPRHVVIGTLGRSWGRWEADIQARWQSGYRDFVAPDQITLLRYRIGNYATANARLAYRVTDALTIALAAQQLNAAHLVEVAGPPVDRRITATVTLGF